MVEYFAVIKFSGATPKIAQREINSVVRDSYEEVGEQFVEVNLPKRFTYHGGKLLGYAPRKRGYTARKKRKYGHIDPLVFTGESRDNALNNNRIVPRATRNNSGVRILINAPKLNFRNPRSEANPSEEIRRVAPQEVGPLKRRLDSGVQGRFDAIQQTQTQRIG